MLTVYTKNETVFTHNGLGVLLPTKCLITEELNGMFELTLEHPFDSQGKWENLVEDNIIKAPTSRGNQLFRIYRKVKKLDGVVVYARHIFYDLIDNFIEGVEINEQNGQNAINAILSNTQYAHNFTGESDITMTNSALVEYTNPIQALLSDAENSFVNKWGGEIERDNFTIRMKTRLGADNGVTIRYKKNLVGLEVDIDESEVVTRVMPTAMDGEYILELPEKYIDSPRIGNYPAPKIRHYHYTDLNTEEYYEEEIYDILRERVQTLYNVDRIDEPAVTAKVSFVLLSKTDQYKDYAFLEDVNLGDTVRIIHEPLKVDYDTRVVKTVWNALAKKYDSIELGSIQKNIAGTIARTETSISYLTQNKASYADLFVVNQKVINLDAVTVKTNDFEAQVARINFIENNYITSDEAYLNFLKSTDAELIYAKITDLNVIEGNFNVLNGKVGNIDTILSKEVFAELAEIGQIVAGSSIIAEGAIGDAHISSLSADKLSSGTVDTSKVSIIGPDGRMRLTGNKLQIFDDDGAGNLYERIFLGVDSDDAKLTLRGADGQTILLTQDGLTDAGFTDGYNKLQDNSLDPKKLDIQKVVTRINDGTTLINWSKIQADERTLDVVFTQIENTIEDYGETITNHSSQISANAEAIQLKVWQQDIDYTLQPRYETFPLPCTEIPLDGVGEFEIQGNTVYAEPINGNFINTNGWTSPNGSLSVSNSTLIITGNGTQNVVYATRNIGFNGSKKVFFRAWARITNTDCQKISIYNYSGVGGTGNGTVVAINNPAPNQWYLLHGIATPTYGTYANFSIQALYADATTANGKVMEVKEVMLIDLDLNGLENKTADEINLLLPNWFEGFSNVKGRVISRGKNRGKNRVNNEQWNKWGKSPNSISFVDNTYVFNGQVALGIYKDASSFNLKPNTQYVFSFKIKDNASTLLNIGGHTDPAFQKREYFKIDGVVYNLAYNDPPELPFLKDGNWHTVEYCFKTPSTLNETDLLYIQPNRLKGDVPINAIIKDIQLELGTTATTYEPYKTSFSSVEVELRGLPNGVSDSLENDKLVQRVGKVIFDGSDDENWYIQNNTGEYKRFVIRVSNGASGYYGVISDYYKTASHTWATTSGNIDVYAGEISIYNSTIRICENFADVSVFKQWLQDNPVTVYYELAEPIITDIKTTIPVYANGSVEFIPDTITPSKAEIEIPTSIGAVTSRMVNKSAEIEVNLDGITQTVQSIESDLSGLDGRVTNAEGSISILAGQISLKADASVVDGLSSQLSQALIDINALESEIVLKVTQTEVDNALNEAKTYTDTQVQDVTRVVTDIGDQVTTNTGAISTLAGQIELKADSSVVDSLGTRITTAEENIDGLQGEIVSKVTQTEVNAALNAAKDYTDSKITQNSESWTAEFNKIGLAGEQAGITKIGIDGLEVDNSDIGTLTKIQADGFKIIRKSDGTLVGGILDDNGVIVNISSMLINSENTNLRLKLLDKFATFDTYRHVTGMEVKNTANDNILFGIYSNNSPSPYNAVYMDFAPNGRESLNTSYMYVPRNFKLTSVDPDDPTAVSSSINFSVGGIHQYANLISFTTDEDIPNNFMVNQKPIWHGGNLPVEKGTWTPSISGLSIYNYFSTYYGRYMKIGNYVYIWLYLKRNSNSLNGEWYKISLPFPPAADHIPSLLDVKFNGYNYTTYNPRAHFAKIGAQDGYMYLYRHDDHFSAYISPYEAFENMEIFISGGYYI